MDQQVSRQQMIVFIQSQPVSFEQYGFVPKFELIKGDFTLYQYPVNTKMCNHQTTQELDEILQSKCCSQCGNTINSYKDLVMDIRWAARLIVHPSTGNITIIQGKIFHKFKRPKQYLEFLQEPKYIKLINHLLKNHITQHDFINIAKDDVQYQSGGNFIFLALCLLDKVKIQIPVRHKDCRHLRCYELTSLLAYRKQILSINSNLKQIKCLWQCDVEINLDTLEQEIVLDQQLFKAIQKSRPHSINFQINSMSNEIIDEYSNDIKKDMYIRSFYRLNCVNRNQMIDEQKYSNFEKDVFTILEQIYQFNLSDSVTTHGQSVFSQLKLLKYQDQNLNLYDQFLKDVHIQYPVRCLYCDFIKFADIRTYIGYFLLQKCQFPMEQFKCPLCYHMFQKSYGQIQKQELQNYIYLDNNLLNSLQHRQQNEGNIFKYEGRTNMQQEFMNRHKIFVSDVKQQHQDQNIEYTNLNCSQTGNRLKIPLLLHTCPARNYVDFDVFYEELKKVNFDFEKGLQFCQCQTCMKKPIRHINQVIFDEFFYIALIKLDQYEKYCKTKLNKMIINVKSEEIVDPKQQIQNKIETVKYFHTKPRFGFAEMQNENGEVSAQFQESHISQSVINQSSVIVKQSIEEGSIIDILQSIAEINITVRQDGIQCEVIQQKQSINQFDDADIVQRDIFKVSNLKIDIQNNSLNFINSMEFEPGNCQ